MQTDPSVIVNSGNCAQLFSHEATRVFHDRLMDDSDREMFYQSMADIMHDYFKVYIMEMIYWYKYHGVTLCIMCNAS